jgi:hypothetical protein
MQELFNKSGERIFASWNQSREWLRRVDGSDAWHERAHSNGNQGNGHSGIAVECQATDLGFPEDTRWVDASCAKCGNPAGHRADEQQHQRCQDERRRIARL